ncbi:isoflavone reductase-like protein [Quercus suber]|uniref:Isoflavone reductase-like protein n=1 Tax=Quercus suber TaxID=58331 RepID=A0AAW0J384_QUESU
MAHKSKVLIIGGTGYIGKFIVEASAKAGHPTFALVRESTVSDPVKGKIVENFKNLGVTLVHGDLYDHGSLVKAIKQVDVVISTVGHLQIVDQVKIIAAIKEAGNVKRFYPSEFGNDVDRVHAVDPAKTAFASKAQIRRAVEAAGIPFTYVSSNYFAGYFLPTLAQPGVSAPPRDKVVIPGDGNPKAIFNKEEDIGTYTIKSVDDPRALNKVLYIRPPGNIYSFNELVALWEKKIGKTIEKIYVPEEKLLKDIQEAPIPINVILSINHSVFVKGDHTNFEIEPSFGVEASQLYPDVKYTSVEEYLDQFRFYPSEFGNDVDRVHAVDPAKTAFASKAQIRRAVEAAGIPFTYVSSNYFAGYFLPTLAQPGVSAPPRDKVVIPGDGNPKAIFNKEEDIGTYTIKSVDDPRALNKVLYIRPPGNIYSFNELVALWEKKIGKTIEKIYVPEEKLLKDIQEAPIPINVILSINHSVFVKGDHTNFEIEPSFGVEASQLYPDVKYTSVEEYLDQFV